MATTINTSLQNRQADSWGGDLDSGFLDIYDGSQPTANQAPTGNLLVSIPLQADAFGAAVAGVATMNGTPSGTAGNSGTAGYGQLRNAANTRWMYFSVTATGGGGTLQLDTVTINNSDLVTLTSATITQPAS